MSYRVVVDSPQRIRALASSAKISAVDAKLEKTQVVITRASYAASASAQILNAFAGYAKLTTQIQYQNLLALDVALDPYSLNKYFRLEGFGVADLVSLGAEKRVSEELGTIDELQSLILDKGVSDSVGIGDFTHIAMEILRAFSDSISSSDTAVTALGLGKFDSVGAYDFTLADFGKGLADTAAITDVPALLVSSNRTDTTGVTDQFSKAVVFNRDFDDSASVAESLGALVVKPVIDTTHVADVFARTVSYSRIKSDEVTTADSESWSVSKGHSDITALTDVSSLSVGFIRDFDDYVAMDDFTDVGAIEKQTTANKGNVFSFSDTQTFGTEKLVTDAAVLSEVAAISTSRAFGDEASVADAFQKITIFNRAPDDSIAAQDASSAAVAKVLSDAANTTDTFSRSVGFERVLADAVSFSEQAVSSFTKGLSDTSSMTDSLSIQVASLSSSVLNAGALNTVALNN